MPYAIRDGERERKIERTVPFPLAFTLEKKNVSFAKFSLPVDSSSKIKLFIC
jgi:hypothetical protein